MKNRIVNLDYLRGLCAVSILFYHLISWTLGRHGSETIWGRIGVYGVSEFYVLSGITMYRVYLQRIDGSLFSLVDFFGKRFFRIYPLMILVGVLTILENPAAYNAKGIFIGLSGIFSIVKPGGYIGGGVWSIGNELFFYITLPLFILAAKRNQILFYGMVAVTFALSLAYSFMVYDPTVTLSDQWGKYINPINQWFLFTGGILIAHISKEGISKKVSLIIGLLSLLLFVFYPAHGNTVNIVSGFNRILFSLFTFGIAFFFLNYSFHLNRFIDKVLSFLGEISYSVYLIHPVVFSLLMASNNNYLHLRIAFIAPIFLILSFLFSFISYRFVEKPFIEFGARLISKWRDKRIHDKNQAL